MKAAQCVTMDTDMSIDVHTDDDLYTSAQVTVGNKEANLENNKGKK